ncbi:DUF4349 domain-containing protein [bacterium]|nr:DUF4349 domain-containing protein [bacterium]
MQKIINWIKTNKLSFGLALVVLFLLFGRTPLYFVENITGSSKSGFGDYYTEEMDMQYGGRGGPMSTAMYDPVAPRPDITDRKVITTSHLSALVTDVTSSVESVKSYVNQHKGYTVNESISRPEAGETATLVVRIPTDKVDVFKDQLRKLAVKVTSEKIDGTDITDQYVDMQERISRLEKTKARLDQILASAETVEEIMSVQDRIFMVQDQIDSYKGQLQYMDGATSTSKITIYLSEDELSLPYLPDTSWRPNVIFKKAVRSMIGTLQSLGTFAIWFAVYIPIILLLVVVVWVAKKIKRAHARRVQPPQT